MSFDFAIIERHAPELLNALGDTLYLSFATAILSTPIALGLALAMRSERRALTWAAGSYITIFRMTPVLVILYFAFYGLPSLGISLAPLPAALLGLIIASSAYMAEDLRGGLGGVAPTQWEAARALGLGYWRTVFRIIIPQALPQLLPPFMSRLIVIVKSTALASIVSVDELTGESYDLISNTYHAREFLGAAAFFYLLINGILALVQVLCERYVAAPRSRRGALS